MIYALSRLYITSCLLAMVFLLQCSVHCMDEVFLPANPDGVSVVNFPDECKSESDHNKDQAESDHDVEKNLEPMYGDFLDICLSVHYSSLCSGDIPKRDGKRECRKVYTLEAISLREAMLARAKGAMVARTKGAMVARTKGAVVARTKGAVAAKTKGAKPRKRCAMTNFSLDCGVERVTL